MSTTLMPKMMDFQLLTECTSDHLAQILKFKSRLNLPLEETKVTIKRINWLKFHETLLQYSSNTHQSTTSLQQTNYMQQHSI
eukprot:Pgem_evm1s19244